MLQEVPVLTTARLALRPFRDVDAPAVLDQYSRPETVRYIRGPGTELTTIAQAQERIDAWRAHGTTLGSPPPRGVWAIDLAGIGMIGTVLLKDIPFSNGPAELQDAVSPPPHDVEIGWHLHPDQWGRGYATEAAAVVLERAFTEGLDRVVAVTNPDNEASQSVCRRLGMRSLGTTDLYYDVTCALFEVTPTGPAR